MFGARGEKPHGYQLIIKTGSGHFPQFNNHCLYSNDSLSPLAMALIISAISGMKLESGFAYHCSEPQSDIGRTSQTHIHDSAEIFFLVSFTALSRTIATRPTNVMQIRCVATPALHTHAQTHKPTPLTPAATAAPTLDESSALPLH